jgi:thiamine kinase-like enzyme
MSDARSDPADPGASVRELLDRVPRWRGRSLRVEPLSGGLTNRNFRVEAGGEAFVLRAFSAGAELLGIDRAHECACTRIAAEIGVGPELIHAAPADDLLVVRFVDAPPLSAEQARRPEVLARIAAALRRVHSGPAFPGEFSPFRTVREYFQHARALGVGFPAATAEAMARLREIEAALAPVQECRPCHNDLLAANLLDDGQAVWIIDWEYGGMGDPFFDLGNFAVNQGLSDADVEVLLRAYCGAVRGGDLAQLRLMQLASDLRESFWGFLQSGVSRLDFDYHGYGARHLERFRAGAADPRFASWLAEAGRR